MPTLSASQIATVANSAGFTGDSLVTATAIALAESGGRTDVVNYLGCVGLWQIYQSVHAKKYPHWTTAWLKNPQNNAQAAYILSNGGKNWQPWEVYTNGMYKMHMVAAREAVSGGGMGTPPGPGGDTSADIERWNRTANTLTNRRFWLRFTMVVIGIALLFAALMQMTGIDETMAKVSKSAVKVAVTRKVGK